MRTIEVAGPVAAGKSSAVQPLRDALAARGIEAMTLATALDRHGRPRRLGRLAAIARFAARHPRLLLIATGSLLRSPISVGHRLRILRIVLMLGSDIVHLERHAGSESWVIIDEGWLHRCVNLFAWRSPPASAHEIGSYVEAAPVSPIVMVLDADPSLARRRLLDRGLPKRLRGRGESEVEAFLASAASALETAADRLRGTTRGVRVIRVPNDGTPEDLAARVDRAVGEIERDLRRGPVPTYQQRWPSPPRPDRSFARAAARRQSARADTNWLPDALDDLAISPVGEIRPPTSPGGRGTSFVAVDRDGRKWLLKRYKPALGDDEIRIEHATLLRLAEAGFPSPRLRRTASGGTLWQSDQHRVAAFAVVEGVRHPHELLLLGGDGRRLASVAGATLAELHEVLADFVPPGASPNGFTDRIGPRTRPATWHLERLALAIDGRARPAPDMATHAPWIARELERLETELDGADLRRTVIHGDYGPYNLLVRSGRPPFVVDFELARIDWRLTDLATAVGRFAERRAGWHSGIARAFVAGYRSRSEMAEAELALLPSVLEFLALRRVVVCIDREAASGDRGWLQQARTRLGLARRLARGDHPLHSLVGA